MPNPLADHLAQRFADDARALRARQQALATQRGPVRGPSAADLGRMADACDRVQALFAGAESDDAVRALLPTLAGHVAGAASEHERAVYAGAVSRATQALEGDPDEDGADDDGDDDGDDGEPAR